MLSEDSKMIRELRGVVRTGEASGNALRYIVLSYLTVTDLVNSDLISLNLGDSPERNSVIDLISKSQYYRESTIGFTERGFGRVEEICCSIRVSTRRFRA